MTLAIYFVKPNCSELCYIYICMLDLLSFGPSLLNFSGNRKGVARVQLEISSRSSYLHMP